MFGANIEGYNYRYLDIFKEFENLSVQKKTLSTALGFEPRPFDCHIIENFVFIILIILPESL